MLLYNEYKGVLYIDSGVEYEKTQKAREEILNQIEALATGDFTDDEMNNAVLSIIGDYKSIGDTTTALSSFNITQKLRGDNFSPEQAIEAIKSVTREEIIESAKSFKMTQYIMITCY